MNIKYECSGNVPDIVQRSNLTNCSPTPELQHWDIFSNIYKSAAIKNNLFHIMLFNYLQYSSWFLIKADMHCNIGKIIHIDMKRVSRFLTDLNYIS